MRTVRRIADLHIAGVKFGYCCTRNGCPCCTVQRIFHCRGHAAYRTVCGGRICCVSYSQTVCCRRIGCCLFCRCCQGDLCIRGRRSGNRDLRIAVPGHGDAVDSVNAVILREVIAIIRGIDHSSHLAAQPGLGCVAGIRSLCHIAACCDRHIICRSSRYNKRDSQTVCICECAYSFRCACRRSVIVVRSL